MLRKLLAGMLYSQARWALGFGRSGMSHAYRLLRLCCALWPGHPEAGHWLTYLRGRIAVERGRPEEAIELLREADCALPNTVGIRADLGLAYTMAGKDDQAISIFERLLKEGPAEAREEVWSSLAWSYLRTGRAPKARAVCQRADEVGVRSPRLELIQRLATGVGLGSLPVNEIRELVRSVPQSLTLLLEYARQQARDGLHRLARATVSALPEDEEARAYSIIAHASLNEDDPNTAHWAAEQIARTQDEAFVTEALLLRSEVAIRRGDLAVAVDQARQALVADPQSGRAHEQLGRALLLQGKWDAALSQMIEALHTGQAGSLAAGVAALGALDDGDLAAARGLFLAERYGDGLACAVSHAAQARLLQAEGEVASAVDRATSAIEELRELPAWAASPEAVARLATALRGVLTEAGGAEEESVRADAERGLASLEEMKHTTLLRRDSAPATPLGPPAPDPTIPAL